MSPHKAFEAIKQLFPTAKSIAISYEKPKVTVNTEGGQKDIVFDEPIEWPFGVSEWPPRDDEWREVTIADDGKPTYIYDMTCAIIGKVKTVCSVLSLDGTELDHRVTGLKVPIASTRDELKSRIESLSVKIENAKKMLASLDLVESLA